MAELQTTKDFQTKMFERIRDQIGDLLSEEDLQKIVASAVDKALWEKQKVRKAGYSDYFEEVEGVLMSSFRPFIKDRLEATLRQYLKDNDEKIMAFVREETAKLWAHSLSGLMKGIVEGNTYALVNELKNQGLLR